MRSRRGKFVTGDQDGEEGTESYARFFSILIVGEDYMMMMKIDIVYAP